MAKSVNSSMYFFYFQNHLAIPAGHGCDLTYGKIPWVLAIFKQKFKRVRFMQAGLQTDKTRNQ
jgi:hypothetical protein